MNRDGARELARRGELYPGVILHGADAAGRREAALDLARMLLCAEPPAARPCGSCVHCRRIVWPAERGGAETGFHPDFRVLERDLKAYTSVEATRALLRLAQVSPFEARGQVFVVASADSLTGEAANALLKTLEEPPRSAPRHFLLLAPSQVELLPTIRSRCLSVYLGPAQRVDDEAARELATRVAAVLERSAARPSALWPLVLAQILNDAGDFQDPRDAAPWAVAARAVLTAREVPGVPDGLGRPLLALAEDLLGAPALRLRGITAGRILEGLAARHLAAPPPVATP